MPRHDLAEATIILDPPIISAESGVDQLLATGPIPSGGQHGESVRLDLNLRATPPGPGLSDPGRTLSFDLRTRDIATQAVFFGVQRVPLGLLLTREIRFTGSLMQRAPLTVERVKTRAHFLQRHFCSPFEWKNREADASRLLPPGDLRSAR